MLSRVVTSSTAPERASERVSESLLHRVSSCRAQREGSRPPLTVPPWDVNQSLEGAAVWGFCRGNRMES